MVDFKKLRKDKAYSVPSDPIEIFRRLPKSPGINDLWNSQAEALREWYSRRNDKDVVIKLNTGGGKTLVGLLIAQSIMNECHGPTLYLCPTTQLVDQTLALAKQYGIRAVPYERDENLHEDFFRGSSMMVATYAALFNGQSKFGIFGGRRDIVEIKGLILDDAHTAFSNMRQAFTISIDSSEMSELYSELTNLFRSDFKDLGKQGTFDDVVEGSEPGVLEVPYWSWKNKSDEVRQRLARIGRKNYPFEWPLLRDSFDVCHALISNRDFSITPMYPLVDFFPTFTECPRRVYMSATLAEDSSIIRIFDADPQSISKPIVPTSLAGVGERMILAPGLMLIGKDEREKVTKHIVKNVAKSTGVVIIVPSIQAAAEWQDVATLVTGSKDVGGCVASLVSRSTNGPYVFPNRYDGIDLPGDSCRLLVIAGLPRGATSYDLYRAAIFEGSSALTTTLAQRVEQGMGRTTRGAGDYCVVLLTGKDLTAWISKDSNFALLTHSTRAQLEMGNEVSKGVSSSKELLETISKCLERDRDWVEYHAETLAESIDTALVKTEALDAASCERRFFKLLRDRSFEKAISILLSKFIRGDELTDLNLKGWLLQLAARAAYYWDNKDTADELQRQAYSCNRSLLRPKVTPPYIAMPSPGKQSSAVIEKIFSFKPRTGYLSHFEEIVAWLNPSASSNQFEESLKQLGAVLGFQTERPENDFGKGPDVLWLLDDTTGLVIEAKSRKDVDNPLTKEEHGQLLNSFEWFKQKYPQHNGYKVIVHPNAVASTSTAATDTYALTLDKLLSLVSSTGELVSDFVASIAPPETLKARCEAKLAQLKLTPAQLIRTFLEPFSCID